MSKITKEEHLRRDELFKQGILVCGHCKRELPKEMFTKERNKKNGYASMCKDCQREQGIRRKDKIDKWMMGNKERLDEYIETILKFIQSKKELTTKPIKSILNRSEKNTKNRT